MLERGNDILLKAFSPDNVLNSSSYLDFLYTRNIFSSDEYLRKLELQSIVGISGFEIPHYSLGLFPVHTKD